MPGSTTTRGWLMSRHDDTHHVAFCGTNNIGTPNLAYAAQYLACAFPCERFAASLADRRASLGAGVARLGLHRGGLAPPTFRRSPGALVHT